MKDQFKLFPEDSHASHSAKLEDERESMMNATCGTKCFEQFKRLNPSMSSQRMSMASRILMADWYSSKCALTWKMKGTKFNRILFQLVPKTLPIAETDVGLLPTITSETGRKTDFKQGGKSMWTGLRENGMLPTPTTKNATGGAVQVNANGKRQNKGGTEFSAQLHDLAKSGMLPTPSAGNEKSNGSLQEWGGSGNKMRGTTLGSSRLSTRFVGEMMGFPKGWTESPFLSGETNQSKHTGTQ